VSYSTSIKDKLFYDVNHHFPNEYLARKFPSRKKILKSLKKNKLEYQYFCNHLPGFIQRISEIAKRKFSKGEFIKKLAEMGCSWQLNNKSVYNAMYAFVSRILQSSKPTKIS